MTTAFSSEQRAKEIKFFIVTYGEPISCAQFKNACKRYIKAYELEHRRK